MRDVMDGVRIELGPDFNKIYFGWVFKGPVLIGKIPLGTAITREEVKAMVIDFEHNRGSAALASQFISA